MENDFYFTSPNGKDWLWITNKKTNERQAILVSTDARYKGGYICSTYGEMSKTNYKGYVYTKDKTQAKGIDFLLLDEINDKRTLKVLREYLISQVENNT